MKKFINAITLSTDTDVIAGQKTTYFKYTDLNDGSSDAYYDYDYQYNNVHVVCMVHVIKKRQLLNNLINANFFQDGFYVELVTMLNIKLIHTASVCLNNCLFS